ncbi:hypothetical protein ACP275_09G053900 [Erythranthe tilingii]
MCSWDIGDPTWRCDHFGALMWYVERLHKRWNTSKPKFSLCCLQEKIELPILTDPPHTLTHIFFNNDARGNFFLRHRSFNSIFSFTSMGERTNKTVNGGDAPPQFIMCGENYHRIGIVPNQGSTPKFSQLRIYVTQNEMLNRMRVVSNPETKSNRIIRDMLQCNNLPNMKLRLIGKRDRVISASEVAALIVRDFDYDDDVTHITVETQSGLLQRASLLNPAYISLQYPLLFPRGEYGYRDDRQKIFVREFFAYRIQDRDHTQSMLLYSKNLFQQFMVDDYRELRAEMYKGLSKAILRGEFDPSAIGKRIILPTYFTRGARYMIQNYQDAIAIYKDHDLYNCVKSLMIHGQCGVLNAKSPCMQDAKCTKYFLKKFSDQTLHDEDGYPIYRTRDNGFFVPHNSYLLKIFNAHIIVEWCNQSRSIKYLLKYVNKGHDRVTGSFCQSSTDQNVSIGNRTHEIQMYYVCRYLSPCEAAWRVLSFDIHYREPPVEHLSLHLPDEQMWFSRKQGFTIGRLHYVAPRSGETYYLRILFNTSKRVVSCFDLRKIVGATYPAFRDACYSMGLLDDDKEYIDGNREAIPWGTCNYLRSLLAILLFSNQLSRPKCVWDNTWQYLSDDIGFFFIYGYGGTGKTYIWRTLSASLRSKGEIVLMVASNVNEDSTCNMAQDSPPVNLIARAKLIIWDEAPMKHCFEAVTKTFKDILKISNPNSKK